MAAVSGEPTGSIGGSGGCGGGAHGVARREGISPPTTWRLLLRMRDLLPIRSHIGISQSIFGQRMS
uniref:Uncharacterized protein n=1 Tax=Oryza meridionalis TaxID=40149 RepID=A0A0E0CT81_9ORYZ